MLQLLRLIALLGVLATEAWLLWNPEGLQLKWDALAGFFAALLGLFLLERKEHQQIHVPHQTKANKVTPADVAIFDNLLVLLQPTGAISFLREHDFGGTFFREDIAPLHTFVSIGGNPDNEFIDPVLEKERKYLLKSATELATLIAKYTSPNDFNHLSVLPSHLKNSPRPDWVRREAKELNDAANQFVEVFDNFVRFCRARIANDQV